MARDARKQKYPPSEKNSKLSGDSSQWMMFALNEITERLSRLEEDVRDIKRSMSNINRLMWIAAGAVAAVTVVTAIVTFFFGFVDIAARMPFEITIKAPPAP